MKNGSTESISSRGRRDSETGTGFEVLRKAEGRTVFLAIISCEFTVVGLPYGLGTSYNFSARWHGWH